MLNLTDKKMGALPLAFIMIAVIISPIGMVIMAQYGFKSLFYYALVILLFFIPSSIVFAELGSAFPDAGGLYSWTTKAFGKITASLVVWLRWLSAIITFPVIITFIAHMSALIFAPQLANSPVFAFTVCLIMTSISTFLAYFGIQGSAIVSFIACFGASIIPSLMLIGFASFWLLNGHIAFTDVSHQVFWPSLTDFSSYSLLGATVLMFSGMELAAYCLKYTKNPRRQYPIAVIAALVTICLLAIAGTLSVALLVPTGDLSVVGGMMQAFLIFLKYYQLSWVIYPLTIMMIAGWICVISTIMTTLSFGFEAVSQDKLLPPAFTRQNRFNSPTTIVITQGAIALVLSSLYIIVPMVNAAYWNIEAMASVLMAFSYVALFAAAIKLRYSHGQVKRIIRVPGGKAGMWLVAGSAIAMCTFAGIMTFVPPDQFDIGSTTSFEVILLLGCTVSVIIPLSISYYCKMKFKK